MYAILIKKYKVLIAIAATFLLVPCFTFAQMVTVTPSNVVISAQVGVAPVEPEIDERNPSSGYRKLISSVQFSGHAEPFSSVFVYENGQIIASTVSNVNGDFLVTAYNVSTQTHSFIVYATRGGGVKSANATFLLTIPHNTVVTVSGIMLVFPVIDRGPCPLFADLDCDNKVDIVDFNIMKYWYNKKTSFPAYIDLNNDRIISMIDFSILAYNWTN